MKVFMKAFTKKEKTLSWIEDSFNKIYLENDDYILMNLPHDGNIYIAEFIYV
jgi:hypothetical protein